MEITYDPKKRAKTLTDPERELDFEDAVQVASAIKLGLEAIVTRDLDGFTGSPIPVLSPKNMRNRLM